MTRPVQILFFVLLLFCNSSLLWAQSAVQQQKLFVHFDKTVYSDNEIAWFTAYLLNAAPDELNKHEVLSVALIRDMDSTIVKQDKYLMGQGLSLGCMLLPDSLLAGNYHFLATTNRIKNGIPDVHFVQSLLIKSSLTPPRIALSKTNLLSAKPVLPGKATVSFYPEGGHLVDLMPCTVAWEVRDEQAATITTKALLYANNVIIDTVETNAYGMGKFMLSPKRNTVYTLRLIHSAFADGLYQLPASLENGLSMSVPHAAVNDTLQIWLRSSHPQTLHISIHDRLNTDTDTELKINRVSKLVKIPILEMSKGIHTVTIADSAGRPLAERMFFAHYDPVKSLNIATDNTWYNQRQKVSMALNLQGADTIGVVSIAVVQDNRISSRLFTDIESYNYLNSEIADLPTAVSGRGYAEQQYVEDLLLTRGWRKYTWLNAQDKIAAGYDPMLFKIAVNKSGKRVKKATTISYIKDDGVGVLATDNAGELVLTTEQLTTEFGKKMHLLAGNKVSPDYDLIIQDPYVLTNMRSLKLFSPEQLAIPSTVRNDVELVLNSKEKINRLEEVVIKVRRDNSINFAGRMQGSNECGDYVCVYNILNCPNHFGAMGNTQPQAGKTYNNAQTKTAMVYSGCNVATEKVKAVGLDPVYSQKEFYVNDFKDPQETSLVSTLFWTHAQVITHTKQEITFYTSDITGKFRVVIQGVGNKNLLFGQYTFEVKAK